MAKSDQTLIQQSQLRFRMPRTSSADSTNDPIKWFADRFSEATEQYGPAFLEGTWIDADSLKRFIPAYLNEDFFAAILGGDRRLGHRLVFYPPEDCFYFYDYRVDAYCPTTEEKLKLLLSNYLVRCSQDCGALVDITNLVVKFRQDDALSRIIEKSKAVLETERCFFEGKDGKRRWVDGKYIEPNEEPLYRTFVKRGIVPAPGAKLVETDVFHRFYEFCRSQGAPPLTRADFRSLVTEVIREEFNLGLRHDVLGDDGRQHKGWIGITYRHDDSLLVAGRN